MTKDKGKTIYLTLEEAKFAGSVVELELLGVKANRVSRKIREKSEYEQQLERLSGLLNK